MATTTTNFGWDIPQSTDLVKDGATAIAALGQDIDTAFIDLKGGTTGQVLAKASGTDLDFSWVAQDDSNAIQNAIVDAKGDLIAATAADTPARLAVGTNGQVLTADSTAGTGLAWATPSTGDVIRIATTTFSASSGVTLNDVFSSTYKNYMIVLNLTSTSAGNVRARLRVSGADNTTSNYNSSFNYSRIDGTNDGNSKFAAASSWIFSDIAGGYGGVSINLFNPFATEYTVFGSNFFGYNYAAPGSGEVYRGGIGGTFAATTSFTGITIYPAANTITGEVSIYGLKRA